eukprot:scaffold17234_cov30-Tisochrysis_lutea.AAC.1
MTKRKRHRCVTESARTWTQLASNRSRLRRSGESIGRKVYLRHACVQQDRGNHGCHGVWPAP